MEYDFKEKQPDSGCGDAPVGVAAGSRHGERAEPPRQTSSGPLLLTL